MGDGEGATLHLAIPLLFRPRTSDHGDHGRAFQPHAARLGSARVLGIAVQSSLALHWGEIGCVCKAKGSRPCSLS